MYFIFILLFGQFSQANDEFAEAEEICRSQIEKDRDQIADPEVLGSKIMEIPKKSWFQLSGPPQTFHILYIHYLSKSEFTTSGREYQYDIKKRTCNRRGHSLGGVPANVIRVVEKPYPPSPQSPPVANMPLGGDSRENSLQK